MRAGNRRRLLGIAVLSGAALLLAAADGHAAPAAAPQDAAPAKDEPSGPQLEIYGFAQGDGIYDFNRVGPDQNATLRPSRIPVECPGDPGCGNDGETIVSARQSRLGAKGRFPTSLGELRTLFEFDLFGVGPNAGETTFRLRHAWGELGVLGGGQTWSLFMDPDVFPDTIDYWGPAGMVFLRNPQLRWTPSRFSEGPLRLALALESPGAGIDEGKAGSADPTLETQSWNSYPDVTGQLRLEHEWGHLQAAGILRGLGVEARSGTADSFRDRSLGWGVNLSGALKTQWLGLAVREEDQLLLQVAYGHGIANYMNDGGVDVGPHHEPPTQPKAIPTLGWLIYYNHRWSERWSSSLGLSEHRQRTLDGQLGTAFESGRYASANLLYRPVSPLLVGVELLWGRRENRDGDSGTDTRVQFSAKYSFSGTLEGGKP
jgi:hypothetical protein